MIIEEVATRIRRNIQTVVVGHDSAIDLILAAMLCEGHVLIEDVPGTGKTTLAKALAVSLGCTFKRIQFTPDLLPTDVTGVNIFYQKTQEFSFLPGPVFSQILLADEINRAAPRTQSALLEAMQERQVTAEGETRPLPRPFLILATQNPIELEGTFPLPEAQLDRFLLRVNLGYPSENEENTLLKRFRLADPLDQLVAVTEPAAIKALIEQVRSTQVSEAVQSYIVQISRRSRSHEDIALGASPRATLALYRVAQAWAALHGDSFVTPDHVKAVTPYVLVHRMIVSPQMRIRGRTAQEVITDLISTVPVPVEPSASA